MSAVLCDSGFVVALEQNYAVIEFEEHEACKGCGACSLFSSDESKKRLRVLNSLHVSVGDRVSIELDHMQSLIMALWHYGLPLSGFVGGILISSLFFTKGFLGMPPELWQFLCGAILLCFCGLLANIWSKRMASVLPEFARMKYKLDVPVKIGNK